MRKCCGLYCAMIALVGIFFYAVVIVMEMRKNNYVMYKMQFPAGSKEFQNSTSTEVRVEMEKLAKDKITPLIIAIGLNVLCALGCILQVKLLNRKERFVLEMQERQNQAGAMQGEFKFD